MALKKCPECQEQVSEIALFCPHCGYVLDEKRIKKIKNGLIVRIDGGKIDIYDFLLFFVVVAAFVVIALSVILTKF